MPIDLDTLWLFIPISLALNITPGSDMLFCLGQGIRSGPKAGVAASLGIATGSFIRTTLAALGLAAVIASYPLAFEVIRWSGVAYLLWLAVQVFRQPPGRLEAVASQGSTFRAWRDGIAVSLLNPKVTIFVLAFLPQFVDPSKGSTFLQFLILGAILTLGGMTIGGLVGGFAGSIGRVLATSRRAARALQMVTGVVFVGLAFRLAFDRR